VKTSAEIIEAINALPKGMAKIEGFDPSNSQGNHGGVAMFKIKGVFLAAIWSCDLGWDHVSVSCRKRTPKYQEMKFMKRLFFRPDEWAVEYHPADENYISTNDNVLHIWRPHGVELPQPPRIMV